MSVSDQELALLRLVEEDRARRCAEILAAAEPQAAELRRQAHREARERVRAALTEARERAQRQIAAAAAQLQTRQRLAQQDCDTRMLDQAFTALPGALIARWQQPATRRQWLDFAMHQAAQLLPRTRWRIEHAPDLTPGDIGSVNAWAESTEWEEDAGLGAGVRIHSNGNCIDASLQGLRADRDALAARLLQAWEAAP